MSILRGQCHELLAQDLAKGPGGKAAYSGSDRGATGRATELGATNWVRKGKVVARVAEL